MLQKYLLDLPNCRIKEKFFIFCLQSCFTNNQRTRIVTLRLWRGLPQSGSKKCYSVGKLLVNCMLKFRTVQRPTIIPAPGQSFHSIHLIYLHFANNYF